MSCRKFFGRVDYSGRRRLNSAGTWIMAGIILFMTCWANLQANAGPVEITLGLLPPEYYDCGNVSINGVVLASSGTITRLSWDWGDGTVADSWFPASHRYRANGAHPVTVTAFTDTGETQSSSTTADITNAEDALCNYSLMIYPANTILRGGNTSALLRVDLRDSDGASVSLSGKSVFLSSSNPAVVQVDSSGVVSSTGFGEAEITVSVAGYPLTAKASTFAGEFRIEPPILLLATNGQPTGQLNLIVANADGSPLNLTGRTVTFSGGNGVAQVSGSGLVTALRPPQYHWETPYITAAIDGIWSHNAAVIRVTSDPLNLNTLVLQEPDVIFYIPPQIGSFNYQQIFQDFDVPRITNIAYQLEKEVTGLVPFKGDVQYMVNDPGHGQDGTVPCGASGNPVRLGTDVDTAENNSCLIVAVSPATPQWGVFFHEMGHNFTYASPSFAQFTSTSDVGNSNFTYSEGLATAVSMYVGQMMNERAAEYQIPANILNTITSSVWHFGITPDLDAYINSGADYFTINPSVLDDIISVISGQYGYSILPRIFSVFLPPDSSFGRFGLNSSDASQATFFVTTMSAAVGADLRSDFRNKWGFPIDDSTFSRLYPELTRLIAQYSPAVPGAPREVLATAGDAQATVSFTPPSSDGGSQIISYAVTSTPGNIIAMGSSSPITVTGLTNGTPYTFTVTATNSFGTGPESLPSNSVTPVSTTYSVSGRVLTPSGTGIAGVRMTLGGAGNSTTTTDSMGRYRFTSLANGSYTVKPSKTGYTFTPATRSVTISGSSRAGLNFTGTTYSISGRVTTPNGTGISGVRVTLGGARNSTTTTDSMGRYRFTALANGCYTVKPSKYGYTFTPTSRNVTISGSNRTGLNFIGKHWH